MTADEAERAELLAANAAIGKIAAEALRRGARLHREVKEALAMQTDAGDAVIAVYAALARWEQGERHQSPVPGDPS